MTPAMVYRQVLLHAASHNMMASDVIVRRGISPRTCRAARLGNVASLHTAAALILLLEDIAAKDRILEVQSHGENFVVLRAADFHPSTN